MIMSEKCKEHVDSCRFCWMCHHICPIGNASGQERNTARARALGISLVNRGAMELEEIIDNIYECSTCGACVHDCTTGWDPVMFTKEARLQAALEDKLPDYINKLVDNCLELGNAYGKKELCEDLKKAIADHSKKTDTLLYLGVDARYMACKQALKAIKALEKLGVEFTVLEDEKPSGSQLDFLISAADETKQQMLECSKQLNDFKTVVIYDPNDAKTIKQLYNEYKVDVKAKAVTFTSFIASIIDKADTNKKFEGKKVVFQDPYQLARDLEETKDARKIISKYASLDEMLLNKGETVWGGNILMAQYMPDIIKRVALRRIFNAKSIKADIMVTACIGEYISLKNADQNDVEIISIEDLILD